MKQPKVIIHEYPHMRDYHVNTVLREHSISSNSGEIHDQIRAIPGTTMFSSVYPTYARVMKGEAWDWEDIEPAILCVLALGGFGCAVGELVIERESKTPLTLSSAYVVSRSFEEDGL